MILKRHSIYGDTDIVNGTTKEILNSLKFEAKNRKLICKALNRDKSKLDKTSSKQIDKLDINQLVNLLSQHSSTITYEVVKAETNWSKFKRFFSELSKGCPRETKFC